MAASSRGLNGGGGGGEDGGSGDGGGSVWSQLLGRSVNDFYFELAVRVVEVCNYTQMENGGLLGVREAKERLMKGRMEGAPEVSE